MQILAMDLGTEALLAPALGAESGEPDILPPFPEIVRLDDFNMLMCTCCFRA